MDIIEFAMNMEKDGLAFYSAQAKAASDPELKKIFQTLAEEEKAHYAIFKRLKDDPSHLPEPDMLTGSTTLAEVKNIFNDMAKKTGHAPFGDDVVSAWTEALRIEEKAEKFYREKAGEETDQSKKKLLERIAQEEYNHVKMIDSVLMYVKHPQSFAESAQFKNFRSLEGW